MTGGPTLWQRGTPLESEDPCARCAAQGIRSSAVLPMWYGHSSCSIVLSNRFCLGFIMFRPRRAVTAVLDWMLDYHVRPKKGMGVVNEQTLFNLWVAAP
jgi:hypothetical protein